MSCFGWVIYVLTTTGAELVDLERVKNTLRQRHSDYDAARDYLNKWGIYAEQFAEIRRRHLEFYHAHEDADAGWSQELDKLIKETDALSEKIQILREELDDAKFTAPEAQSILDLVKFHPEQYLKLLSKMQASQRKWRAEQKRPFDFLWLASDAEEEEYEKLMSRHDSRAQEAKRQFDNATRDHRRQVNERDNLQLSFDIKTHSAHLAALYCCGFFLAVGLGIWKRTKPPKRRVSVRRQYQKKRSEQRTQTATENSD